MPVARPCFVSRLLPNYGGTPKACLSEQHSITLNGIIPSSGSCLTAEIIELMQVRQRRLMISLDGLGEVHDRQHPYARGHGSSADVAGAVDAALDHGLTPHISITVSSRNAEGLPELTEWLLE